MIKKDTKSQVGIHSKDMRTDTQSQQVAIKEDRLWKLKGFLRVPRLYVSLLETKDRMRAITLWGFNKNEGGFMVDRFDVEEKEKVEAYFVESISVWKLLKMFFRALLK